MKSIGCWTELSVSWDGQSYNSAVTVDHQGHRLENLRRAHNRFDLDQTFQTEISYTRGLNFVTLVCIFDWGHMTRISFLYH